MRYYWLFILIIAANACRKPTLPEYTLEDIAGRWQRIYGEKPEYDGMTLEVYSDAARVEDIPSGYYFYFPQGAIKWESISPHAFEDKKDTVDFLLYELASDGSYYLTRVNMVNDSLLYLSKGYWMDGDVQVWKKK